VHLEHINSGKGKVRELRVPPSYATTTLNKNKLGCWCNLDDKGPTFVHLSCITTTIGPGARILLELSWFCQHKQSRVKIQLSTPDLPEECGCLNFT
jgi:hypothetical protein